MLSAGRRIILLCICATAVPLVAQKNEIIGVVTDVETGSALEGANVSIPGTRLGTATDARGRFRLKVPGEAPLPIRVSMIGYQPVVRTVQPPLAGNEVLLKFKLKPAVLQMGPVTVTGALERNVIANPGIESPGLEVASTVISAREIRQQGADNIVQALEFAPGALVESRGRKVKQFFSVRGQRYPYPEYAVNGAWQREFHEMPYFFPTTDIERIEVVRSSAALLTGINGMAGIVNIVTKEYESATTTGEVEYGSYGSRSAHISHCATIGTLSYAAGVGTSATDGPAGLNAGEGLSNFYGNLKWRPARNLTVRYNLFYFTGRRELRLAEEPAAKRFRTEISRYDPYRAALTNLKVLYRFSDRASAEMLFYYTDRKPVFEVEDNKTGQVSRVDEADHEWGAHVIQSVALGEHHVVRFGGLYNRWVAPNGKRFYVGRRNDLYSLAGVIVDEMRYGPLTLDGGIRIARTFLQEYGAFNIEGSGKNFERVDPVLNTWEPAIYQASFGAAYVCSPLTSLFFNAALGQVQPRRGTLAVSLQPPDNETRLKLDIGLRIQAPGSTSLSLAGFLTRQKNALVLSGTTYELDNRVMELYLNRDQEQYGLELDARKTVSAGLQGFANLMVMQSRARTNGTMEKSREYPDLISSAGLYFQSGGLDGTCTAKYVSAFENTRFAAAAADGKVYPQPLGDFLVANLNVGYSVGREYMTRVYVEINNLFDDKYSTVVGYPDFGRTMTAGLRLTF